MALVRPLQKGTVYPLLLLATLSLAACSDPDPKSELLILAGQQAPLPFDGRLTPAVGAPPPVALTPKPVTKERARRWRSAFRGVAREAAALPPGPSALRLGIMALARGRADQAVAQLSAAAAHEPQNPDVQNTLAVAHLTRGLRQGRAFDLVLALAAADRALKAAPDSPAIRYNRARILSALHLRHQALKAWDAYLEVADDRDAETEVQEFREPLVRPDQRQRWLERKDQLERLSGASRQQAIAALTAEFPYQTRIWAENELLAKWAEAAQRGDSSAASRALDLLRAIAAEVARQRGDHLLAEAVAAIEASSAGSQRWKTLVDGHRHLPGGPGPTSDRISLLL